MSRTSPHPIDVLLVDDHRLILAGLAALIDSEAPRLRVVGRATHAGEALILARTARPHVVVLDADLAGDDGLALIPFLESCCRASVVVFSVVAGPHVRQRAFRLGATGFVPKTALAGELIAAISEAARNVRRL